MGKSRAAGRKQGGGLEALDSGGGLGAADSGGGALRFAPAGRAVADTALLLTELRDVRAVVAEAVQCGRCTVPAVIQNGPHRGQAMGVEPALRGADKPPDPFRGAHGGPGLPAELIPLGGMTLEYGLLQRTVVAPLQGVVFL